MPRSVSVPEKTLEHWSSQYLTYRYRSKAALWWPASREDINVRWLPNRPGKAVQLELKTTTVVNPGLHDVLGPTPSPGVVGWRDFWTAVEQCGRAGWPQLIRLPARVAKARGRYLPPQVAGMLREAAGMPASEWDDDGSLVTLEPDADGNYQVTSSTVGDLSGSDALEDEDETDDVGDHRQIVFLDARALFRQR
jgi:hypothetical protein